MGDLPARILTIAGSDSGGGAGIQADIKTITMLGGHAMTAITAITAQNSRGVDAVQVLDTEMVIAQIDAVARDFGLDAIKIGMLGSPAIAEALADWLTAQGQIPVVFDPVMIASSGAVLADPATIAAFRRLMGCATLVTPNLPELGALGGEAAVLELAPAVLIKGGHAPGETVTDRLVNRAGETARWDDPRIHSPHAHGTGCTLSSAIATLLGQGCRWSRRWSARACSYGWRCEMLLGWLRPMVRWGTRMCATTRLAPACTSTRSRSARPIMPPR